MAEWEIVEVLWLDANSDGAWMTPEEVRAKSLERVLSCGYLIHRDRTRLILAQSLAADGQLADTITIPTRNVIETRRVGKAKWE